MLKLPGVSLITGGASGIGQAIALQFSRFGCTKIAIIDRNEQGLEETEQLILKEQPQATVLRVSCDVSDNDAPEKILSTIVSRFSRLDYLVNCAGIPGGWMTAPETPDEVFDQVQSVNVRASWRIQKRSIKQMMTQEPVDNQLDSMPHQKQRYSLTKFYRRGSIVNIGSAVSQLGMPALSAYVTSKHAVLGFTRASALDHAKDDIRINCVAPGMIQTNLGENIPHELVKTHFDPLLHKIPAGRFGTTDEVANCVVFLSSKMASYVTGTSLIVDGAFSTA